MTSLLRQNNLGSAYNKEPLIQSTSGDPDGEEDASDDPNEGRTPYVKKDRAIGYGPLRIGTKFCFTEDIYSLLFIAFVHKEYKEERQQEKKRRRKLLAEKLEIEDSSDTNSEIYGEEEEAEEEGEDEQEEQKSDAGTSFKTDPEEQDKDHQSSKKSSNEKSGGQKSSSSKRSGNNHLHPAIQIEEDKSDGEPDFLT